MAKETSRDKIWNVVIKRTLRSGEPIKPSEIVNAHGVSEHTARDTLNTMELYGILERETLSDDTIRYRADREFEQEILSRLVDESVLIDNQPIQQENPAHE